MKLLEKHKIFDTQAGQYRLITPDQTCKKKIGVKVNSKGQRAISILSPQMNDTLQGTGSIPPE